MTTPTSAAAGTSPETREPDLTVTRPETPRWYQSIWFAVVLAAVAGFSYALLVMGPTPLNPKNVNWVAFDPANGICATDAHVRVAVGLDYLGAAPVRGTRYGGGAETLAVSVVIDQAQRQMQN